MFNCWREGYKSTGGGYRLYQYNIYVAKMFSYLIDVPHNVLLLSFVYFFFNNMNLCYYNFECAHSLGIFTAFNNIISNIGYVMLGLLFLDFLNWCRDLVLGIPQHYGLFYAMGLALTMEGLMSACYHMCPNFSNFQFDTAYMYILGMLIMLKIYQTRHPDVNASAHSAYMVMAVVIFLGVLGVVSFISGHYCNTFFSEMNYLLSFKLNSRNIHSK
ncbi:unnamed protein product [Schistosoma margrebowiei]|uniref:Uncharacterized protein n=1 Tax=Schistosoma margrebowiei TaxID=48269 RepID=A0A183N8F5_9TREM|nr:unnamed protein product [Schistosoma margrebowiei]